jgi:hypothetical protein
MQTKCLISSKSFLAVPALSGIVMALIHLLIRSYFYMRLKLIACDVLTRLICHCVARTPHVIDMEFTKKGDHNEPEYLREVIQQKIDSCENSGIEYDAIVLGYGLCGNSILNLITRKVSMVVPRAHDCCTLFLGSKDKFKKYFGNNPSLGFTSIGYTERGDSYTREASKVGKNKGLNETYQEYVKKYGEDNARYIWETLHPKEKPWEKDNRYMCIEIPEFSHLGFSGQCKLKAQTENKIFVELDGSIELIEKLIFAEWSEKDFLIVKPNQRIKAIYDMDEIIRAI